jgi:hypothetical protein
MCRKRASLSLSSSSGRSSWATEYPSLNCGAGLFCCYSGYDLRADSLSASAKNVSGPLFSLLAKRFSRLWGCRLIAQVAHITDAHRIQNKTLWSRSPLAVHCKKIQTATVLYRKDYRKTMVFQKK